MKLTTVVVAIYICALYPLLSIAETHNVSIRNSAFSPNDLVIQAGDTVVWTYTPIEGDCSYGCPDAVLHNVTADDQSFTSGPPAEEFTYQQSFVQAGEILYHCEVHSEPGLDIKSFMNGRITVQREADAAFQINPGLNDAWYDPATIGQGFLISVFPEIKQVFLAWFTFDTERPPEDVTALLGEPGHRWGSDRSGIGKNTIHGQCWHTGQPG